MFRKIVLGIVITLALAVAGGWMFLRTQGDVILQKFSHLVEKNTGKPLHMETLPEISLFPGLSLTLGPSSWGEQEDAVSVSFSRASIRLSASALLAGRMELTGLEADDLQILCRFPSARPPAASSPAGQSASPAAAEDSPVQDAAGRSLEERVNSLLALAPDAAILNRASIVLTWEDGRSCAFSDIALKLTNARPNATLGLEASGHVSFRQKPNNVLRRAGLSLESNLACKNGAFTAIVHKALIHPEEHMGFTQDAALSGGMSWTPESGVLELNRLETSMPGLTLSASGTLSAPDMARLLATAPHDLPEHVLLKGTGGIQASCKGSPRLLLQALGRNPFPDETALSALNASAVLSLKSGHLVLEKLEGSLDGTSFSGSLDAGIEPPMLRGRLNLGELVPTRYAAEPGTEENSASIPRVTERRTENGATVLVVQPWPALDLTLTVERLVWRNLLLNNIQARISGDQGTYSVNPLTFTAWNSHAKSSVDVVLPSISSLVSGGGSLKDTDVRLQLSAEDMDLRQVMETLPRFKALRPDQISGKGRVNARLGFNAADAAGTLKGQGSISASPLHLRLTDLASVTRDLKGLITLLGGRTQGMEKIEKLTSSGTDFEKVLVTFSSDKGVISVTDARCVSPELELSGKGTINLPKRTLDLAGSLRVAGAASLPVSVRGTLDKPSYHLDMGKKLKNIDLSLQPGGRLEREISRGLGKLFK